MYIAVIASFIASFMTFLWGAIRLVENGIIFGRGAMEGHIGDEIGINMIAVVDAFLLGTILYIFAVGLYELFIGELKVPAWLVIRSLDDLKAKLQSVIIMIMAVLFLEHLAEWQNPLETLMFGAAVSIVTIALVFYGTSKKEEKTAAGPKQKAHGAGGIGAETALDLDAEADEVDRLLGR